jgi:hypothetical protein
MSDAEGAHSMLNYERDDTPYAKIRNAIAKEEYDFVVHEDYAYDMDHGSETAKAFCNGYLSGLKSAYRIVGEVKDGL